MSEIVRGVTVEDFARLMGMSSEWIRHNASVLGKKVAELYRAEWSEEPPTVAQVINGHEVRVNVYVFGRQHHLRDAWRDLTWASEPDLDLEDQEGPETPQRPAGDAQDVISVLVQAACASWIGRDTLQRWALAQSVPQPGSRVSYAVRDYLNAQRE